MNEIEINARITALVEQRNEQANRCVNLTGIIASLTDELKTVKTELNTLKESMEKDV